ncbi:MAG: hypothetical protein KF696_10875, partial [Planctomycetes bacterium]|nr:hypothetical protein [Planctomycetota bacterium]MCW8135067.1 hypothetical protein [Planctomycetota bacterium]
MRRWLLVAVLVLTASGLQAQTKPLNETDPINNGMGIYGGTFTLGWEFQCNAANVQVTQLGVCCPNAGSATASLWDTTATSTPIATAALNVASRTWTWGAITPVTLVNGRRYRIAVTASGYYFGHSPPAVWRPTGTIQYTSLCEQYGTTVQYPGTVNSTVNNAGCADI